ncbi:tripartite motif-containing protein 6-like [Herpailurus yagouaroundi]|uniref:tripartite motif-containing protein 6-like n=1 Tax=Herpailurus yagouaroundi TaxID=1608482 RepID=UPI001AD6BF00|nr:tripartite motif-containing protein 6-like [Puma yagouaroundi]
MGNVLSPASDGSQDLRHAGKDLVGGQATTVREAQSHQSSSLTCRDSGDSHHLTLFLQVQMDTDVKTPVQEEVRCQGIWAWCGLGLSATELQEKQDPGTVPASPPVSGEGRFGADLGQISENHHGPPKTELFSDILLRTSDESLDMRVWNSQEKSGLETGIGVHGKYLESPLALPGSPWSRLCCPGMACLHRILDRERDSQGAASAALGWPVCTGSWTENVSPSLDPDTASPKLALSEDRKTVRRLFFEQELPNAPSRFDRDPCVLGLEQFSAGRYYWEVQVGHRKAWNLGVCLESLDRKGRIPKSPQHGLWALELYKKGFWALAFPRVRLHPSEPLHRVGVFLDCDAGRISFYSVSNGSLIYAFSGLSFSAPLRPFFCLWTHDPSPLTICSERQPPEALGPPQGEGQDRWEPSSSKTHDLSAPACHQFGGDVSILSPS